MTEKEKFEEWWPSVGQSIGKVAAWLAWEAALSAAPTPPEVEPVGFVSSTDIFAESRSITTTIWPRKTSAYDTAIYTSPPSPKAEWDAEGNPLNLRAAAEGVVKYGEEYYLTPILRRLVNNLRKFLGEL